MARTWSSPCSVSWISMFRSFSRFEIADICSCMMERSWSRVKGLKMVISSNLGAKEETEGRV